ncbi:RNA polymerase I-specific transcription initiation factor RRN3 isoform X1 [Rana temporaria]|uniref:RNA polymerase I-specific transcription initiation factor RRN3 isoform X1 n=1 Tax=Rana temporaria TaxID=8407 RepID=UPI001AAC769B|nr:RNA polymerase I-specific transcription initiation factor RRN3 isoform X1 [Rana temporaria]XP_040177567.1 RNA polymerase I-specific transcription initiation factor RRN3 isoform X1 [Rana temporaria]XP_040177568.1 RNA polymerase I-specific transcription initiation factor RRN3 isoform X1 [Rana temporaria]
MTESHVFLSNTPKKTVRFGGKVTDVLAKYSQGNTQAFELLKRQLSDPEIKDVQLINWLYELRISVTHLTIEYEQLVSIVLKLPWLNRSKEVVEEYLSFLAILVSGQTVYLRPCINMIVSHFLPPRVTISEGDINISDSEDGDEDVVATFNTCHRALQIIAQHVPSAPCFLMPILVEKFPYVNKSPRVLECYIHNLLRITVYFPGLRREILELVTEKLLKIDVNASRQDIEDAEQNACIANSGNCGAEEDIFNMDEDEDLQQGGRGVLSDTMVHPAAERLDLSLSVFFAYIKEICFINGSMDLNKTKALYRDLLAVFDKFILPTHASCHVQFTMFYICSFKLELTEAFLEHLWKKLQNPNNPAIIRQTAASYIGSFLSRAKFIPLVTVKACLDLLVNWLHSYIDIQDAGSRAFCDVTSHGPFYAVCQAVFYTVIFRHKQLLEGNLRIGLAYLQALNFERIVMCQLNPLKICLPTVVNFFAAITRKYQLVFCYTILERNNRQMIPTIRSSTLGSSVQTCANPLDSFFPFDACVLKRCKKMIDPIYQPWEESNVEEFKSPKKLVQQGSFPDDEDDFLKGEMPQNSSVEMTPGSYDSFLKSPLGSVGSPSVKFLQRRF